MTDRPVSYGSIASTSDVQFSGNSTELINLWQSIATNIHTIKLSCKMLESCCRALGTERDNRELRGKMHMLQLCTNTIVGVTTMHIEKLNSLVRNGDKKLQKLKDQFSESIAENSNLQMKVLEALQSNALPLADVSNEAVAGEQPAIDSRQESGQHTELWTGMVADKQTFRVIVSELIDLVGQPNEEILDMLAGNEAEETTRLLDVTDYENRYWHTLYCLIIIGFVGLAILVIVMATTYKML